MNEEPQQLNYGKEFDKEVQLEERPAIPKSPHQLVKQNGRIVIQPLTVGFMVEVGCVSVAVKDYASLIKNLESYFEAPRDMVERIYKNGAL